MVQPKPEPKPCHYCGGKANTKDHIVPKSRLIRPYSYVAGIPHLVPACSRCNQLKGANRSTCNCYTCRAAWAVYGPCSYRGVAHKSILIVDVKGIALAQDQKEAVA